MLRNAIIFAVVALASITAFASGSRLTCADSLGAGGTEKALLKQAPSGATRIGEHILEVKYSRGVKRFVDVPPYDELSGIHWHYCGYNKSHRVHLLGKSVDSLFTGMLVQEDGGRILNAGQTVCLSPAGRKFLAIAQEDGQDGENWTLYTFAGKKMWAGYAGVTVRFPGDSHDSIYAQFVNPIWNDDGSISAQVSCSNSIKGTVTLRTAGGKAKWLPTPRC